MSRNGVYTGNELIALAAIDAGCRFYAGYPITPSSEVMEVMSKQMPKIGGAFIQMEDEIASMAAAIGAAWTGVKTMTASSGPGISLKAEHIGYACITETPVVIVNIMRGGPSTGFPTAPAQSDLMQAKWGTHGDHPSIAIVPGNASEMYYETVRAFNLAEEYRTPVMILGDEIIGHMNTAMDLPEPSELDLVDRDIFKPTHENEKYLPFDMNQGYVPKMGSFFEGYRFHLTGLNHNEAGYPTIDATMIQQQQERMMNKVAHNADKICKNEEFAMDDCEILIVATGTTGSAAKLASKMLAEDGKKAGVFRPITIWPFPDADLNRAIDSGKFKSILVAEANLGQMVYEVERINKGRKPIHTLQKCDGTPVNPNDLVKKVQEVL